MTRRILSKIAVLLLSSLLIITFAFPQKSVRGQEPTRLYIDPSMQQVELGRSFDADSWIESFFDVFYFGMAVEYDTSLMDAVDVNFYPPYEEIYKNIDETLGIIVVEGQRIIPPQPPVQEALVQFNFVCTGLGESNINIISAYLRDPLGNPILIDIVEGGRVTQFQPGWYTKPAYPDYAPSGMPDFDQRQGGTYIWQDQWGAWSHCGPVAVANSIWWFDSKYELLINPASPPPPAISDSFPLVRSYGPWDDHDPLNLPPFVEHLAYLMDCDGRRTSPVTGLVWSGTYVWDMQAGLTHYLSWSGVNPLGDIDGDGIVNQTDVNIVNAAMGTVPGMPGWDMRADIFPATTTYPPVADNLIDSNDLGLVMQNLGQMGIFYEHTEHAFCRDDFFYFIEEEVEKCQDVVLLLGFYYMGYREGGHYVTVAGVNSTTTELLLSNPCRDDFEAGRTPGRSPVPHVHMPPEPPFITHNNASLVSHDAYKAIFLGPGHPSGYHWALAGYFDDPAWEAIIEYAVITSPYELIHDVAVIDISTCKDGCLPLPVVHRGFTAHIDVTVENQGNFTEDVTVTVYANATTIIGTQTFFGLLPNTQVTLAFIWNTQGYTRTDYTIWADVAAVSGETDLADNTLTDGTLRVVKPGDIDGNGLVQLADLVLLAKAYGSKMGEAAYNPNADINDDHKVSLADLVILAQNYGT